MKLKLQRIFKGNNYTIGNLYIDNVFFSNTLEDAVRDKKIKHETAIPAGTYEVKLTLSARFGKILPILLNVPNFEGIRIHAGNSISDTSGCILVGENKIKGRVINSQLTMQKLMDKLKGVTNIQIEVI